MMLGDYELHPACTLLPQLLPEELLVLRTSIATIGQLETIKRWDQDGSVLDGRNRLQVCLDLGVAPRFETISVADPWDWCWAQNIHRRHIEPGRRAALRLEYDEGLRASMAKASEAAAARKTRGLRRGQELRSDGRPEFHEVDYPHLAQGEDAAGEAPVVEALPPRDAPDERRLLATASGVTPKTAHKAIKVYKERRDLHAKVCAGDMSLEKADRERRRGGTEEDWKRHEAYYTPEWVPQLLAGSGFLPRAQLAVECCVGNGAIVRALRGLWPTWFTMDIREVEPAHDGEHVTGSWLDPAAALSRRLRKQLAHAELVITNSAFAISQEVVEAAWEICPKAQIWILQRRTWHDQARAEWFADHQPDELNVSPRIKFRWPNGKLVGGTDNTIHTWYGFSPGSQQPCPGPNGGISRTLVGYPDEGDGQ